LKIKIESPRFTIRRLNAEIDDLSNYLSWIKDRKSNPYISGINEKANLNDIRKYISEKNSDSNAILLGIFSKTELLHIGNIKFEPIFMNDSASVGILIGETNWRGVGAGFEVMTHVFDFFFSEFNLKKLELGVHPSNIQALKLYKKLGFKTSSTQITIDHASILQLSADDWVQRNLDKTFR
jgi:ribosomal-protein-alanine N-acetyltransferase